MNVILKTEKKAVKKAFDTSSVNATDVVHGTDGRVKEIKRQLLEF